MNEAAVTIRPVLERQREGLPGEQRIYSFPNHRGASVIRGYGTYGVESGRWELAVIRWQGDDWELDYSTPITDDVIGWLDEDEIQTILVAIRDLPNYAFVVMTDLGGPSG